MNISLYPTLSWVADKCAQSHAVYFGTNNPPPLIAEQTDTNYHPSLLAANTTYYWRIDEINFFGTTNGSVQRFTTLTPTFIQEQFAQHIQIGYSYPNPFNAQTQIELTALKKVETTISIFNQLGQEITVLCAHEALLGVHTFVLSGKDESGNIVPKGLYFVRINALNELHESMTATLKIEFQ